LRSTMSYMALNQTAINPSNLRGTRIGVVQDSTFHYYLMNQYGSAIKLHLYRTNEDLINALANKQIDIILIDSPVANYWVGYSTGLFKIVGVPLFLNSDRGYGIAVKKDNMTLLNDLNNAVNTLIQNGSIDQIKQFYFTK